MLCAVSIIQLMLKFLLAYQEGHYIAPRVVLYAYDTISIVYANTTCTLTYFQLNVVKLEEINFNSFILI